MDILRDLNEQIQSPRRLASPLGMLSLRAATAEFLWPTTGSGICCPCLLFCHANEGVLWFFSSFLFSHQIICRLPRKGGSFFGLRALALKLGFWLPPEHVRWAPRCCLRGTMQVEFNVHAKEKRVLKQAASRGASMLLPWLDQEKKTVLLKAQVSLCAHFVLQFGRHFLGWNMSFLGEREWARSCSCAPPPGPCASNHGSRGLVPALV